MDNITINNIVKSFTQSCDNYLGVFTISQLYDINFDHLRYTVIILFIDNISKKLGHWTSIIKINKKIYFLDSFGLNPKLYNLNLKRIFNSRVTYNYYYLNKKTQSEESSGCGAYVVFYIHTLVRCKYRISCFKKSILQNLRHENTLLNDHFIYLYVSKHFNDILPYTCKQLFCNTKFIINRKSCIKHICK